MGCPKMVFFIATVVGLVFAHSGYCSGESKTENDFARPHGVSEQEFSKGECEEYAVSDTSHSWELHTMRSIPS